MRLIDADALKHELKVKRDYLNASTTIDRGKYIALNKAITMLDEQPTVDAVPVVRCGECKYAESADDSEDGYICIYHRGTMWFSGCYCSWGVEKNAHNR